MKKSEFVEWNERMFKKYNNVRLYDHPNPFIRLTERMRAAEAVRSVAGNGRVLDLGCGEGYMLRQIRARSLVGVDISRTALLRAAKVSGAVLVRAYAEELPFQDSYFDAAVCSEVIEHTMEPAGIVAELARVVRPGGKIVITVPNEPFINRIKDIVWSVGLAGLLLPGIPRRQNEEWHLHSFDLAMLRRLCGGKLEIASVRAIPFFLFPVRYVAICTNPKGGPPGAGSLFSRKINKRGPYYDAIGRRK
ncbi:MAG: class I SAM-dependent methyltransferase [Candidatus Micrarchaeota archaeon]